MTHWELLRLIRDGEIVLGKKDDEVCLSCDSSEIAEEVFECLEELFDRFVGHAEVDE